jgi:hypothetical protein
VKRIKTGAVLGCEYISETLGKVTLLNVYAGGIIVRQYPARIPLAFYLELPPGQDLPTPLIIEIFNGKKRVAKVEAEPEAQATDISVITIPQLPFAIEGDTTISVVATGEGFSRTTLLKKGVRTGQLPT